jgi:hypothetical protein
LALRALRLRSRRLVRARTAAEPTAVTGGPARSASRFSRTTAVAAARAATRAPAPEAAAATAGPAAEPPAAGTAARTSSEPGPAARRTVTKSAAASRTAAVSLAALRLARLPTRLAPLGRRGQAPLGVELLLGLTKHERAAALGARDLLVAHRGLSGDEGDAPFVGLGRCKSAETAGLSGEGLETIA